MTITLATWITISRFISALCIALSFVIYEPPLSDILAVCFFILGASCDYFDGIIARKFNQVSALGRMLDPIADKILIVISYLFLSAYYDFGSLLLIPATIIVFREFFVGGLREFIGQKFKSLQVTRLAKWKSASQMLSVALLLSSDILTINVDGLNLATISIIENYGIIGALGLLLTWIAALLTFVTGVDYFHKAMPHIKM